MKRWIAAIVIALAPLQVTAQRSPQDVLASFGIKVIEPMSPKQTAELKWTRRWARLA